MRVDVGNIRRSFTIERVNPQSLTGLTTQLHISDHADGLLTPPHLSSFTARLNRYAEMQERILFLPRSDKGRDRLTDPNLRRVTGSLDRKPGRLGVFPKSGHLLSAANLAKHKEFVFLWGGCANCIAGLSPPANLLLDLSPEFCACADWS